MSGYRSFLQHVPVEVSEGLRLPFLPKGFGRGKANWARYEVSLMKSVFFLAVLAMSIA